MQQHISRPRRRWGSVRADDTIERKRSLDRFVLEPAVEKIGGALGEQIDEQPLIIDGQSTEA